MYKRTLPEVTLEVEPNPDLGILTSVRDSLAAMQTIGEKTSAEDALLTLLGLSPRQFLQVLLAALLAAYLLFRLLRPGIGFARLGRERYLDSEAFFFHRFRASCRKKDPVKATFLHLRNPENGGSRTQGWRQSRHCEAYIRQGPAALGSRPEKLPESEQRQRQASGPAMDQSLVLLALLSRSGATECLPLPVDDQYPVVPFA